jgi:hypothetical protein
MQAVHGMVKVKAVHGVHSRTRAEAAQAIVEYIGDCNTGGCIRRWGI